MNILGIETSCDETSAAVVDSSFNALSNVVASQVEIHSKYGGVVPEIASRNHILKIYPVVQEALMRANCTLKDIDVIAVTIRPGLMGSLLVGVTFANGLAFASGKRIVGINHIEGHLAAIRLSGDILRPPFIGMVVSGGHTNIYEVKDWGEYNQIGTTLDDAAGEAFDKVARLLGFGYPGGPEIEKYAKLGDESAVRFPLVMPDRPDISFSGLKTFVIDFLKKNPIKCEQDRYNMAASFQYAVARTLFEKALFASNLTGIRKILFSGGVAFNNYIREYFASRSGEHSLQIYFPEKRFCTDNAAMIAAAAVRRAERNSFDDYFSLSASPYGEL
ncbi:MAG: tRNA (adenosine(37)-N6)-threonylcarbamoyltransferase complex transferase subunit TsaD [Deltaproteobacteria bacterium]|nr:tRNA (adenosine(37)-N6)-threonylcarbamoyltransferase complex transferase subunit TsaD [Deltaproteobacteria bacterium]